MEARPIHHTHLLISFCCLFLLVLLLFYCFCCLVFPPACEVLIGPGHHLRVVKCLFLVNTKKKDGDYLEFSRHLDRPHGLNGANGALMVSCYEALLCIFYCKVSEPN